MEEKGEVGGVLVMDDYAHHPTAIRETLNALRFRYPDRASGASTNPRAIRPAVTFTRHTRQHSMQPTRWFREAIRKAGWPGTSEQLDVDQLVGEINARVRRRSPADVQYPGPLAG